MRTVTSIAGVLTIGGVLTFGLFPLALPFVLLTIVFVAPLLALGAVATLALVPVVLVGVAVRRLAARRGERANRVRRDRQVYLGGASRA